MSTTFKPRTYAITIYQGDDYARLSDLSQAIEKAKADEKAAGPRSMGEIPESVTLTEQFNELLARAEKKAPVVTLQALGRKKWRELVSAHPPRPDHEGDEAVGVNEETFPDDLVPASIVSIKPAVGDTPDFLDALSDAQFGQLYTAAFYLNRTVGDAPKALSAPSQSSGETSN